LSITDDQLWNTSPSLLGFSFSVKKWGHIPVENLSPIQFDDAAFNKLVIPAETKEMIGALVNFQHKAFTDVITGKGGGCIFLLHGSPGVGKTLTAESIAELLHRPLYSVTVGELGSDATSLETGLSGVLEVAATWNAVILLDEADIFLEKRTETDIARNAMVGVFLRLIEYHQGVLFLTTNRVKNFDPAFHSRISIALKYQDLNFSSREQIWTNLFGASGVSGIPGNTFAHHDLNGRQIKNCIRLAQALAASKGEEANQAYLRKTIGITEQFKKDLLETLVDLEVQDKQLQSLITEMVDHTAQLRSSRDTN